jgi:hypothetical protein
LQRRTGVAAYAPHAVQRIVAVGVRELLALV